MFLLVNWIKDCPKAWTVVSVDSLADGKLRKSKNLVGKTVGINWKRSVQQALVLEMGTNQADLDAKADGLAEREFADTSKTLHSSNQKQSRKRACASNCDQPSTSTTKESGASSVKQAKRVSRAVKIDAVLDQIDSRNNDEQESQETSGMPIVENDIDAPQVTVSFKDDLEDIQKKYKSLRKKYRELKKEHKLCSNEEAVELFEGSGVKLDRSEVAAIQTMSASMTIFARNLFRRVFVSEDILGHSLTGRRSTSLPNHAPLPAVDPVKRDAVIEFCLKTYGYEITGSSTKKFIRKRKSAKTSIIKSLSDYMREENSKMKSS